MDFKEAIIWVILMFITEISAIFTWETFQKLKNRRLDLGCDSCHDVCALRETPDKKGTWLCPRCMPVFLEEHKAEFTEEQIRKARRGYRKIKKNRKR